MNTATVLRLATLFALGLGSGALPAADLMENYDLAGGNVDLASPQDAPLDQQALVHQLGEANVALLTQWIDWAFAETKAALPKAA